MRINAPRKFWWNVSGVLGLLALLGYYSTLPILSAHAFWFMTFAWLFLIASTLFKNM